MASSRKRSENWTDQERQALWDLLRDQLRVIEDKNTDTNTNKRKAATWRSLTEEFNMIQGKSRTVQKIQEQWKRLKQTAKKNIHAYEKSMKATGGGSNRVKVTEIEWQVKDALPHYFQKDTNPYDDDGNQDEMLDTQEPLLDIGVVTFQEGYNEIITDTQVTFVEGFTPINRVETSESNQLGVQQTPVVVGETGLSHTAGPSHYRAKTPVYVEETVNYTPRPSHLRAQVGPTVSSMLNFQCNQPESTPRTTRTMSQNTSLRPICRNLLQDRENIELQPAGPSRFRNGQEIREENSPIREDGVQNRKRKRKFCEAEYHKLVIKNAEDQHREAMKVLVQEQKYLEDKRKFQNIIYEIEIKKKQAELEILEETLKSKRTDRI